MSNVLVFLQELRDHPCCVKIVDVNDVAEHHVSSIQFPIKMKLPKLDIELRGDLLERDELLKIFEVLYAQEEFRFNLVFSNRDYY